MEPRRLSCALFAATLGSPAAAQGDRSFVLEDRIEPQAVYGGGDGFTKAFALDEPLLYVGWSASSWGGVDSGVVVRHRRWIGGWYPEVSIGPPNPVAGAAFGSVLAADAGRVAVGAPLEDGNYPAQGAVYVWHGTLLEARLVSPSPDLFSRFGAALAIEGDVLVVGQPFLDLAFPLPGGSAFVYRRDGAGAWNLEATLTPSDLREEMNFGASVDVEGDAIVVGAVRADGVAASSGAAYVFRRAGVAWHEEQKLVPYLGAAGAGLGFAVELELPWLAVTESGSLGGAAHVWYDSGAGWHHEAVLAPAGSTPSDDFGRSLAFSGTSLFVGAPGDSEHDFRSGAAYAYVLEPGNWHLGGRVTAYDAGNWHEFGASLAACGSSLVVGAPGAFTGWYSSGAFYAYRWYSTLPLGDEFCAGDGSAGPCPCGGTSNPGWRRGCRNSYGGARLIARGSASAAAADLALEGLFLPPGVASFAIVGSSAKPAAFAWDGLACVGAPRARSSRAWSDLEGRVAWSDVDGFAPSWSAGLTLYAQLWYRDPETWCGHGTNLSNGLAILLGP